MQISIKTNIKEVTKGIRGFKDQIPYATARALSDVAYGARQATVNQIDKDIDRPTPFTRKAARFKKATKKSLTAKVFIIPAAYKYLQHLITGGKVMPDLSKHAIGVNARRNQYGNTARKGVNTVLAKKNTFVATIKGISGIWQRYGGKKSKRIKLLYVFKPVTQYQANQFKYYAGVNRYVDANFTKRFSIRFHQAIKTAKFFN